MDIYLRAGSWRDFCGTNDGGHSGEGILNIDNSSGLFKRAQVLEVKKEQGSGNWYVKLNNTNVANGSVINLTKGTITMQVSTTTGTYGTNGAYGRVRLFTS